MEENTSMMGVRPKETPLHLDPRQKKFIELYLDVSSKTFGNCYKSALGAGFSDQTARNLTHLKPRWYSESIGQSEGVQVEHIVLKLTEIINNADETTQNKLRAIDMMMKYRNMYKTDMVQTNIQANLITIENVL